MTAYKPVILFLVSIVLFSFQSPRKRVVFFGDSITEAAVKPGGYIDLMNKILKQENLQGQYDLVGAGVSGNKVYDLYLRLEDDVLSQQPDVVVIFVGVNDVWHKRLLGTGTDADKFERFYTALIRKLQQKNVKVVLCTPAVIGEKTDFSNELDGDLNRYSNLIRNLAVKGNLPLVDLRKAFLDYNLKMNKENRESGILTTDRVHLNDKGNDLVANEMWRVVRSI